jgi:hypothetical protein
LRCTFGAVCVGLVGEIHTRYRILVTVPISPSEDPMFDKVRRVAWRTDLPRA